MSHFDTNGDYIMVSSQSGLESPPISIVSIISKENMTNHLMSLNTESFHIYPNPVTHEISIEDNGNSSIKNNFYTILNMTGNIISRGKHNGTIDVSQLEMGPLYFKTSRI